MNEESRQIIREKAKEVEVNFNKGLEQILNQWGERSKELIESQSKQTVTLINSFAATSKEATDRSAKFLADQQKLYNNISKTFQEIASATTENEKRHRNLLNYICVIGLANLIVLVILLVIIIGR